MDKELKVEIIVDTGAVSVTITDKESNVDQYSIWIPKSDIGDYEAETDYALKIGREVMRLVNKANLY